MKVMSVGCAVAGASVLMGCSLLYNPNNLPVPLDAYVDPLAAVIDSAGPVILYEGQGTGGSRPAILAITGHNFAPEVTVALVPTDGAGPAPMIEIDSAQMVRGATVLAVPVTLPIDTNLGTAGASDVKLTLQLTQIGSEGFVATTLPERIVLRVLPELDMPITVDTVLAPLYSRVEQSTTTTVSFPTSTKPVVIRAVGSIVLGPVDANGNGQVPGPAGGAGGGAANALGLGATAGLGPGGGAPGSIGTGGRGGTISSDEWIASLATSGSSGGGGGQNPGGGGGGTLELTAGGTLTVGPINANGAPGGASGLAGGGGGGSGGAIILRSGATAMFNTITAKGGAGGGTGGNAGQVGGPGRLRYDVPSLSGAAPTGMAPTIRQGAMFGAAVGTNPLVTNKDHPDLSLVGGMGVMQFNIVVRDADNNTTATSNVTFTTPNVIITPALRTGYNHLCVMPPGGSLTLLESTNCLDIAYVP
jgi:hypothetical protein